ncbi:MAG: phosphatase PAP2 family protein [Anaerolineae bacterium]|nr:phosphatase PAP2 family protein [Anaerolineae bacterium]
MAQVPAGIDLLLALQSWRSPFWDALFKLITDSSNEKFLLVLVPIILWCIHKELGIGLTYIALSAFYVNGALKTLFHIPRPYATAFSDLNQKLVPLRYEESFSWPSNHAQNSTVMWGYLAYRVKKGWFVALMAVLVLLVGFSRMYLGVHTCIDVISGWTVGAVCLGVGLWIEPQARARWRRLSLARQIALSVIAPVLLTLIVPVEDTTMSTGALMGLSIGFVLEGRYVRFMVSGVWWKRVLRAVVGLLILSPVYPGLSALAPDVDAPWLAIALRFACYALAGSLMAFVTPWLFVKVGLALSEEKG